MSVISKAEADVIGVTWALLAKNIESNGLRFFINLFSKYPDVQTKHFPHMDTNELESLRRHGTRVLKDLDEMVTYARNNDQAKFNEKVRQVTIIHYNKGVNKTSSFVLFKIILLETASEVLGPTLKQDAVSAWTHFMDQMISVVDKEIERLNIQRNVQRKSFKK